MQSQRSKLKRYHKFEMVYLVIKLVFEMAYYLMSFLGDVYYPRVISLCYGSIFFGEYHHMFSHAAGKTDLRAGH